MIRSDTFHCSDSMYQALDLQEKGISATITSYEAFKTEIKGLQIQWKEKIKENNFLEIMQQELDEKYDSLRKELTEIIRKHFKQRCSFRTSVSYPSQVRYSKCSDKSLSLNFPRKKK
jgi:hypothetical protein